MSNPRFRPRAYTTEPDSFGRAQRVTWIKTESGPEEVHLRAAQLQHHFAVLINRRLRDLNKTVRDYAQMTDLGYDRVLKVLRGDVIMRIEDIAQADQLLQGIVTFPLE